MSRAKASKSTGYGKQRRLSKLLRSPAPRQSMSCAVCVSSNLIGRSQASIMAGTKVLLRSVSVASARTRREATDVFDLSTTIALAVRSAVSVAGS